MTESVESLRKLLGHDVLLLPWPQGSKGARSKWRHLTIAAMEDPRHLEKLRNGNIGVALGKASNGLCSIDIDSDDALDLFLNENPALQRTTISVGRRGGNVWIKIRGNYPRMTNLTCRGRAWGEWRADGAQTIIYGTHPDGGRYFFRSRVTPIVVPFSDIRFPNDVSPRLNNQAICKNGLPPLYTSVQPLLGSVSSVSSVQSPKLTTVDDALALAQPTEIHQNHGKLFTLARALKTLERASDIRYSPKQLLQIFHRWYEGAKPFLRKIGRDQYLSEFFAAYENAKYAIGESELTAAWHRALNSETPAEAADFESEDMRKLVALCRELQRANPGEPFFLACRTVQRLLGHETHTTAALWLKTLVRMGILREVKKGGPETNKATRFTYAGEVGE